MDVLSLPVGQVSITFSDAAGRTEGAPKCVLDVTPEKMSALVMALAKGRRELIELEPAIENDRVAESSMRALIVYERMIDEAFGKGTTGEIRKWLGDPEPQDMVCALVPVIQWLANRVSDYYAPTRF